MSILQHKIVNGIKYFVKNTRNVGRTKLFKLLYFWDFMHFKKYGMSVTCYDYYTYPFGPVPEKLYEQIKNENLPELFNQEFLIIEDKDIDELDEYKRFKILIKNKKIDFDWITPNEQEILKLVTEIFKFATAKEMTEITHLHNSPWDKTKKQIGMFKAIDIHLAIDDETTLDPELIEEYYNLQKEMCLSGRL